MMKQLEREPWGTRRFAKIGVATDDIIDCSGLQEGMKVCFFNDPEGNRVELIQGFSDQIPAAQ